MRFDPNAFGEAPAAGAVFSEEEIAAATAAGVTPEELRGMGFKPAEGVKGLWVDDGGEGEDEDIENGVGDDEDAPFILEFALSRGGEIVAGGALVAETPDCIPEWAWAAYLEGVVIAARGRVALQISEEVARVADLFVDEDEGWDGVDELSNRLHADQADPRHLPQEEDLPF